MRKFIIYFLLLTLLGCKSNPKGWVIPFPAEGTNASPRAADLNHDGILDFVIGGGRNLHERSEEGVIALDGKNGKVLWRVPVLDQIFTVLWQYKIPIDTIGALKTAHFNFYTAQLVPDQNADGLSDLLVANGGNVKIPAHISQGRESGVMLLLDSKTGNVLTAAAMPDGKETYLSPVVCDYDNNGSLDIFFGTGGETMGGSFYRATWQQLLAGDFSKAKKLASNPTHGFIAPPVLADLNNDGIREVIFNGHNTTTFAFDGRTDSLLWKLEVPDTETNSSLAPGYFNADKVPDFFLYCVKGAWPENLGGVQMAIDGANGQILKQYAIGCTGFSSPITNDFDGDGYDEAVLSVNEFDCNTQNFSSIKTRFVVFDINRDSTWQLGDEIAMKNLSTTPWLGDADADGFLDLVFSVQMNTSYIINFSGMFVSRFVTKFPMRKAPTWGAYMGNRGDGVF
jgi:outer membrane protein assembly factor BamB